MQSVNTVIATVAQKSNLGQKCQAAVFEECEVVGFACARRHAHNFLFQWVNHDLSFLGITFFLAGIATTLFFLGRSMRCSLASNALFAGVHHNHCEV